MTSSILLFLIHLAVNLITSDYFIELDSFFCYSTKFSKYYNYPIFNNYVINVKHNFFFILSRSSQGNSIFLDKSNQYYNSLISATFLIDKSRRIFYPKQSGSAESLLKSANLAI